MLLLELPMLLTSKRYTAASEIIVAGSSLLLTN